MARNVVVTVTCDQCGALVEHERSVEFSLDKAAYTIDLCAQHRNDLEMALQPFIQVAAPFGKRPGRSAPAPRPPRRSGGRDRELTMAIRDWARENGYKLSQRGRIPMEAEQAYNNRQ